jgi:hypothetical protein
MAAKINFSQHFFFELVQELSDRTPYYPGRGLLMEFYLSTREK